MTPALVLQPQDIHDDENAGIDELDSEEEEPVAVLPKKKRGRPPQLVNAPRSKRIKK